MSVRFVRSLLAGVLASLVLCGASLSQAPTAGYNSPWRNADGSLKLALEFGGGYDLSTGPTHRDEASGWNYRMGAGYNFSRRIGVGVEYSFNHANIPRPYLAKAFPGEDLGGEGEGLHGSVHLWSLTAEPKYHYFDTEKYGGYVLAGGGFYRKLTSLLDGESMDACIAEYPEPCIVENVVFSNNAGGVNFGTGMSWRPSDHSNAKFFLEARYVWVDNQASPHNMLYPAANERTSLLPISAGVHW